MLIVLEHDIISYRLIGKLSIVVTTYFVYIARFYVKTGDIFPN